MVNLWFTIFHGYHIVLNNDYPLTLFDLFTFWPNNYITTSRYISSFWNLKNSNTCVRVNTCQSINNSDACVRVNTCQSINNSDACVRVNTCQSINKSLLCLIIETIFCFNYQYIKCWYTLQSSPPGFWCGLCSSSSVPCVFHIDYYTCMSLSFSPLFLAHMFVSLYLLWILQ